MSTRAHVAVLVVTIVTVALVFRLVGSRQIRSKYGLLWIALSGAMLVVAAFPGLLDSISDLLGVAYPPTAFLLLALAFVLLVIVHYSWELSRTETRLRALAEELALLRAKLEAGHDTEPAPE